MIHDNDEPSGKGSDITASTASWQTNFHPLPSADIGRIKVTVTINLRPSDEAQIDSPLLKKRHDIQHRRGPYRTFNTRGVSHGKKGSSRGAITEDPVFKNTLCIWGMGGFGKLEGQKGQPHPNKDKFSVLYFSRPSHNHQF